MTVLSVTWTPLKINLRSSSARKKKTSDPSYPSPVRRIKYISRAMMARANFINLGSDEKEDKHQVQIMKTSSSSSKPASGRYTASTEQVKGGNVFGELKRRIRGNEVGIRKKKTRYSAGEVKNVAEENSVADAVKEMSASVTNELL